MQIRKTDGHPNDFDDAIKGEFIGLRLSTELRNRIKRAAKQERRKESDMIRVALEDWLSEYENGVH